MIARWVKRKGEGTRRLPFQEVSQIFKAVGIDPETLEEDPSEHSSKAGRIYGRTGGVSQAVTEVFERLRPDRTIHLRAVQADGIPECKRLLKDIMAYATPSIAVAHGTPTSHDLCAMS